MNEPKNVDKICPIFGSHRILNPIPPGKLVQASLIQHGYDLLSCQRDKCIFWASNPGICDLITSIADVSDIERNLDNLNDTLGNLVNILSDLKEEKHGNS